MGLFDMLGITTPALGGMSIAPAPEPTAGSPEWLAQKVKAFQENMPSVDPAAYQAILDKYAPKQPKAPGLWQQLQPLAAAGVVGLLGSAFGAPSVAEGALKTGITLAAKGQDAWAEQLKDYRQQKRQWDKLRASTEIGALQDKNKWAREIYGRLAARSLTELIKDPDLTPEERTQIAGLSKLIERKGGNPLQLGAVLSKLSPRAQERFFKIWEPLYKIYHMAAQTEAERALTEQRRATAEKYRREPSQKAKSYKLIESFPSYPKWVENKRYSDPAFPDLTEEERRRLYEQEYTWWKTIAEKSGFSGSSPVGTMGAPTDTRTGRGGSVLRWLGAGK